MEMPTKSLSLVDGLHVDGVSCMSPWCLVEINKFGCDKSKSGARRTKHFELNRLIYISEITQSLDLYIL